MQKNETPLNGDILKILKWITSDTKWFSVFVDVIECDGDSVVLEVNTPEISEKTSGPYMCITTEACMNIEQVSVMLGYPVRMASKDEKQVILSQFNLDIV